MTDKWFISMEDAIKATEPLPKYEMDWETLLSDSSTFFDTNLTCAITLDYNDPLNPFKHLYHPDHDNLTSDYSTNAPAGTESWSINRTITLAFSSTTNYPSDPMWGTDLAGGVYSETVTGLREYPVRCAGYFGLRRVNRVNVLQ